MSYPGIPLDDLLTAIGASKLRRSKESTQGNTAPEEPEKYKLMEFAFRMGRSSLPSASSVAPTPNPEQLAAPAFPALEDGSVDGPASADTVPKARPVAERCCKFQRLCVFLG